MDAVGGDDSCFKKRVSGGSSVPESEINWFTYVDLALQFGLTVAESDDFSIGMILDLVYTRINGRTTEGDSEEVRVATQADYDSI